MDCVVILILIFSNPYSIISLLAYNDKGSQPIFLIFLSNFPNYFLQKQTKFFFFFWKVENHLTHPVCPPSIFYSFPINYPVLETRVLPSLVLVFTLLYIKRFYSSSSFVIISDGSLSPYFNPSCPNEVKRVFSSWVVVDFSCFHLIFLYTNSSHF